MTEPYLRPAELPTPDGVRRALRVKTVEGLIEADASGIIKMIKRGDLEGYQHGSDWRVYADSLAEYQRIRTFQPGQKAVVHRPQKRVSASAGHREALAFLQKSGCSGSLARK